LDRVSQRSHWEEKFWPICEAAAVSQGLALYDLNFFPPEQKLCLTIMDEATKTATLDHCISVDRALTEPFLAEEWIPEGVVLEVSSPGITRDLKNEKHLRGALGEMIQLTTKSTLEELFGADSANDLKVLSKAKRLKREHIALLEAVEDSGIVLSISLGLDLDKGLKKSLLIAWDEIKQAQVYYDF
jgi:ribosome maturation factor RimP